MRSYKVIITIILFLNLPSVSAKESIFTFFEGSISIPEGTEIITVSGPEFIFSMDNGVVSYGGFNRRFFDLNYTDTFEVDKVEFEKCGLKIVKRKYYMESEEQPTIFKAYIHRVPRTSFMVMVVDTNYGEFFETFLKQYCNNAGYSGI